MEKKQYRKIWIATGGAVLLIVVIAAIILFCSSDVFQIRKFKGFTPFDDKNLNQNLVLDEENLKITAIGKYTGTYMEDGSDDQIENVAAMIVKNESDKALQIAEVEISINNEETALFRITNLPAGGTVMALDLNRLICSDKGTVSKASEAVRFFEKVPMAEEKLEVSGEDNRVTLKNLSEDTYPMVYVYYKTRIEKDLYLGGITYRIPFEEIEGKTQIDTDAAHYSPEKSEIVEIQILNEGTKREEETK